MPALRALIAISLLINAVISLRSVISSSRSVLRKTSLNANIVETAVSNGKFNTLVAAVKAAGFADLLSGPGPFTVFAPTDEAFAKLPAGTLDAYLKDIPKLQELLKYHVHPGKMSPTRNGKSVSTLLIGEDDHPKQVTIKVTNW